MKQEVNVCLRIHPSYEHVGIMPGVADIVCVFNDDATAVMQGLGWLGSGLPEAPGCGSWTSSS